MELPFKIDLTGKTAVVTGGGGILCGTFAKALAICGSSVAVLDLDKKAADAVADEIIAMGGNAIGVEADVLNKPCLVRAEGEIIRKFGPADILINGAGGNHPEGTTTREYLYPEDLGKTSDEIKTFFDLDTEGVKSVFDLNFTGTLLCTQVFAVKMAGRGTGVIINISSMNALTPLTKIPAYSGAKAAVSNFTQWLAVHMSRVNIRVNAIAPGFFITEQNRALLRNPDGSFTGRAEKILGQTPMNRFGKPDDLIGTLLWLVSDDASGFVNGTVISVDGGFSAYSGV